MESEKKWFLIRGRGLVEFGYLVCRLSALEFLNFNLIRGEGRGLREGILNEDGI